MKFIASVIFSLLELGLAGILFAQALHNLREFLTSNSYPRAFFAGVFAACFLALLLGKVVRDGK